MTKKGMQKFENSKDLQGALENIQISLKDGEFYALRTNTPSGESFRDKFQDGPQFRDTFGDGGQWLSSFNNMHRSSDALNEPSIKKALQHVADALEKLKTKGKTRSN